MSGISIREFARREGCSDTAVRKAIAQERLKTQPDGTLDETLVGTAWRRDKKSTGAELERSVKPKVKKSETLPETPDAEQLQDESDLTAQAAKLFGKDLNLQSYMEATRMKENYLALLRQLEYDLKAKTVVPVEDVAREVGKRYATVRSKLLAIPTNIAPRLARLKAAAEIEDALRARITWALEELVVENGGEL